MLSLLFETTLRVGDSHRHVTVYKGEEENHYPVGTLCLAAEEWQLLSEGLKGVFYPEGLKMTVKEH